jgi:hypothetical protein
VAVCGTANREKRSGRFNMARRPSNLIFMLPHGVAVTLPERADGEGGRLDRVHRRRREG